MGKFNDLTNQRFGRLVVLYRTEDHISPSGKKVVYWHCKCDCGKEKDIATYSLSSGATKSCGCLQKEIASQENSTNLIGQRFGKLIVIQPTKERKFKNIVWECKCDCGRIYYVTTNALTQHHVESCGQCISHNSKGEELIQKILIENNIPFEREKTFIDCYYTRINCKCRFDFYINNQYLIEFDGRQHFHYEKSGFGSDLKNIQKRDEFKNKWCKEHNIPLIRIPYTHLENLKLEDLLLETSTFII